MQERRFARDVVSHSAESNLLASRRFRIGTAGLSTLNFPSYAAETGGTVGRGVGNGV